MARLSASNSDGLKSGAACAGVDPDVAEFAAALFLADLLEGAKKGQAAFYEDADAAFDDLVRHANASARRERRGLYL